MDSNDKRMRNQITAHPIQKKCRGYIKYNELYQSVTVIINIQTQMKQGVLKKITMKSESREQIQNIQYTHRTC